MRKNNTQSLSEVLLEYIREMEIERKLKEVDIIHAWEEVLGKTLTRYTGKIYISGGILYVQIKSPVVRAELSMMREEIKDRLNEKAGEIIIKSISLR
jgi:hypothetical protein